MQINQDIQNCHIIVYTYLHYIITNYENLPDVVVFTQARISDHKGSDDINYLIKIKNEALNYSRSINFIVHYDKGEDIHFDKEWNSNLNYINITTNVLSLIDLVNRMVKLSKNGYNINYKYRSIENHKKMDFIDKIKNIKEICNR